MAEGEKVRQPDPGTDLGLDFEIILSDASCGHYDALATCGASAGTVDERHDRKKLRWSENCRYSL